MRILVVDDDAGMRDAVRVMLKYADHEIMEARDGQEALERYQRSGADLVLCDVSMPEQDGLDFLRNLRRHSTRVPVVAMSGGGDFIHGRVNLLPVANFMGAKAALHKPFTQAELLAAIKAAVEAPADAEKEQASPQRVGVGG